jgi:hypothetical protein
VTEAKLYGGGLLAVSTKTRNRNPGGGLRGRVAIVCYAENGQGVWVTDELQCTTRCSVPDITCASDGTDTFFRDYPAAVSNYTTQLDIYQYDDQDLRPWVERVKEDIKQGTEIARELSDAWAAW